MAAGRVTVTGSTLPDRDRDHGSARWRLAGIVLGLVVVGVAAVLWQIRAGPFIGDCRIADVRVTEGMMRFVDSHTDHRVRTVTFEVVAFVALASGSHLYGEIRLGPSGRLEFLGRDLDGVSRRDDPNEDVCIGPVRVALTLDLFEHPEGNHLGVDEFVAMLADRVPMAVHVRAAQGEQVLAESEWMDTGPFREVLLAQLRSK